MAREDHRDAVRVAERDGGLVVPTAAGLDHGAHARVDRRLERVVEREERIGREHRARRASARPRPPSASRGGSPARSPRRGSFGPPRRRRPACPPRRRSRCCARAARRGTRRGARPPRRPWAGASSRPRRPSGSTSAVSRCCTSRPPSMARTSKPNGVGVVVSTSRMRRFFPHRGPATSACTAAASTPGATTTSRNVSPDASRRASASVSGRLNATMPPNALRGSHASAASNAAAGSAAVAAPHGLLCFTITAPRAPRGRARAPTPRRRRGSC